jgi:OmpA-OmpF porin, OOP family
MKLTEFMVACLLLPGAALMAQDLEMQVELMSRVGTDVNRKGDLISGRVLSPPQLQGDFVEGKISDARSGAKLGGKSVLSLAFETLRHGAETIPIAAQVRSIANSKGRMDTDEEGRAIRGSSGNIAKAAGGAGLGGLIGGLAGGGKGALIGAAAGGAIAIVLIQVSADGPNIRLDPGSRITLSARSRSGPALASLTPNAAQPQQAQQAPAPAPVQTAAASSPAAPAEAAPSQAASSPAAPASTQPDLTAIRADFIPGEKMIFFDDFSDMAGDEPPPHWKVRGGTAVLKAGGGVRQLTIDARNATLTANCTGVPANFTLDVDLKYEKPHRDFVHWWFRNKAGGDVLHLLTMAEYGNIHWQVDAGPERLGEGSYKSPYTQPERLALWVQNGRIRFYANDNRLMDVNQVKLGPIEALVLVVSNQGNGTDAIGIRSVRLAESTPDFSQMISSSGRYVTHGILFDTDSDQLKPESAPVIKMIARGLETNPSLKLLIEGHTDSIGNADHNLDLSKRRAEAVRAVLVSQFSVDGSRLTTNGLGSTKPVDSNDTPAGRAQNRRVEFVKQ